jgi:long-chain alkane monooxygenase
VVVGAPEQVVDDLMQWVRAGADGFNLAYMITPGTFKDFIDGVVPVLQRRGLMQTDYAEGTFREKLFGKDDHACSTDILAYDTGDRKMAHHRHVRRVRRRSCV